MAEASDTKGNDSPSGRAQGEMVSVHSSAILDLLARVRSLEGKVAQLENHVSGGESATVIRRILEVCAKSTGKTPRDLHGPGYSLTSVRN